MLVWIMRYLPAMPQYSFVSTVIIAGLVLSFVVNGLVNLAYTYLLVRRRTLSMYVPVWLAIVNFIFLILQLYLVI
ncbi:MAG TPA: hypothetical protein VD993_07990 [Chitinophagaceae bacterium]|nr:hypothetical protein [Chitinophagaceae bacterium]